MHILSKSTFIKGEQCEKALYMYKKHPYLRDKLSIEKRAKFKRGTEVGILAQTLFPNGINMTPKSPSLFGKMFEQTMQNLNDPKVDVMYEAIFIFNETLIMLDILVRDGDKWKAIEVKSSLSLSRTYLHDAALQYYVLKGCNVPISDMQLMYVNENYIKEGDIDVNKLFITQSVKEYAELQLEYMEQKVNELKDVVKLSNAPKTNIGRHCFSPYTCEFKGHCWKKVPKNSFLHISAFDEKSLFSIYNSGITDNKGFRRFIEPFSIEMNQLDALEQGTFHINYKTFYELLGKRNGSTAFLNLLFHCPAVPIIDGHKPYQEIILAFSILSNHNENPIDWNCLDDYSKMEEGLNILTEQLKQYDKIVYFSEQDINTLMSRYNIMESSDIVHKIVNLKDVLKKSDFFNEKTKYDFSLKTIYEGLFPSESIFEHDRIILNATSDNELERILVAQDMQDENIFTQRVYNKLLNQ